VLVPLFRKAMNGQKKNTTQMLEISYTWNKFVNATEPWKHWVEL
jgi:hypothetical protein